MQQKKRVRQRETYSFPHRVKLIQQCLAKLIRALDPLSTRLKRLGWLAQQDDLTRLETFPTPILREIKLHWAQDLLDESIRQKFLIFKENFYMDSDAGKHVYRLAGIKWQPTARSIGSKQAMAALKRTEREVDKANSRSVTRIDPKLGHLMSKDLMSKK